MRSSAISRPVSTRHSRRPMWGGGGAPRPGGGPRPAGGGVGVPARGVPERCDGIDAHPVDLVVALERLGRWCVPGPVTESIAVAPVLLVEDDRCAALVVGELIVTVALPPQVPRAVDADAAGLGLAAEADGWVSEADVGDRHESVDPSPHL